MLHKKVTQLANEKGYLESEKTVWFFLGIPVYRQTVTVARPSLAPEIP